MSWTLNGPSKVMSWRGVFFIEYSSMSIPSSRDTIDACAKLPNPRLIKSHLPVHFLPKQIWLNKRKVIYVARIPKDVVIFSYHFFKNKIQWVGEFDDYVQQFMENKIIYTSYWSHIVNFYRMRNEENVFFVTYEETKRNLKDVIERLIEFLGCSSLSDEKMELLLEHLKFENIKVGITNPTDLVKRSCNTTIDFEFMRRGIVSSDKDELSSENRDKLDNWSKQYLKEYGLTESDIFGDV